MREFFASDYAYGVNPAVPGLAVAVGSTTSGAAVSYILNSAQSVAAPPSQRNFVGPNTNAPMLIGTGTIQETQTPSAVTVLPVGQQSTISFTTVTNAHGNGTILASGTVGLQEALNDCAALGGGAVIVDGRWAQLGGTTAMLTTAANPTGTAVFIVDWRGANPAWYVWNGAAFSAISATGDSPVLITANGAITPGGGYYVITKAGVAAMTLAAPVASQNGQQLIVTSR